MNRNLVVTKLSLSILLLAQPVLSHANEQLPPNYRPQSGIEGTITSVGSDTMVYLVSYWAVAFKRYHPGVKTRILQAGSNTAPPALLDGTANIGPMSRKMKENEIAAFVKKFGYPPTELRVAMDALAVYVHKDNPIEGMTLPQVDATFSSTRKCQHPQDIAIWGGLGMNGAWRDRPIKLFSRNTLSGTHVFFADHALCKGKFKSTIDMKPTSHDVVRFVGDDPQSIGYSGIGYAMKKVRTIPLAAHEGAAFVPATPENVYSGQYPLSRYLYIYVNQEPGKRLPAVDREFLRMVLSADGQAWVWNSGFIPLSSAALREELVKLN